MKTIRVGFSRHGGAFSFIIMKATASDISHTYIRLPTDCGEDLIFQAAGLAVNYCNQKTFEAKSTVVEEYDIDISDEQWDLARKLMVTEVGKPYSLEQIFGFVLIIAAHAMGKHILNPFSNNKKSYVCVELVMDFIGLDRNAESWSPEDLRRWCEKNAIRRIPS